MASTAGVVEFKSGIVAASGEDPLAAGSATSVGSVGGALACSVREGDGAILRLLGGDVLIDRFCEVRNSETRSALPCGAARLVASSGIASDGLCKTGSAASELRTFAFPYVDKSATGGSVAGGEGAGTEGSKILRCDMSIAH